MVEKRMKLFTDGHKRCNELGKKMVLKYIDIFLDAGCGLGETTLEFANHIHPLITYGFDIRVDALTAAGNLFADAYRGFVGHICDLNGEFPHPDHKFPMVLSSQTIEHLYNQRSYLSECYRVLKPGGQLLILTENLSSWANIGALVMGWTPFSLTNCNGWNIGNPLMKTDETNDCWYKKNNEYREKGYTGVPGHISVLTTCGLRDMLKNTGFKRIKIYTRGYLPFWGWLSDLLCTIDKKHGHFIIAEAYK